MGHVIFFFLGSWLNWKENKAKTKKVIKKTINEVGNNVNWG